MGEALVDEVVSNQFERPHVLLNNVTLETDKGTTQIDHVSLRTPEFSSSKPSTIPAGYSGIRMNASGRK